MHKTRPFDVSDPQLTYEIAKTKVWDASVLQPNWQSNNHLNGACMASKAHRAKVPQEWTTWNATQEGGTKFTWPQVYLWSFLRQPSMFMHSQDSKAGEAAFTTATSTWHLQRAQQSNPRVREIKYISFSKSIGSTQWSKLCKKKKKKKKKKTIKQAIFPSPFGWISKMSLTNKSRFDEMSNHNYSIWDLGSP